jgi:hypothetical protein
MLRFTVEFNLLSSQMPVRFNQSDQHVPVQFKSLDQKIPLVFKNLHQVTEAPDVEVYEGSYQATPQVESQIMETAQKFLTDNVTIKAIPFFDVTNTAGGITIYIGNGIE